IINAPTSYGKTMIALDAIIDKIIHKQVMNVLCIVPTKALINEYKEKIKNKLKAKKITNYRIVETPYIRMDFTKLNILIYTQERALVFFDESNTNEIDLVLIDEAQNIVTLKESRTILLLKMLEQFTSKQLILLSPFVKNYKKSIINVLFSEIDIE